MEFVNTLVLGMGGWEGKMRPLKLIKVVPIKEY